MKANLKWSIFCAATKRPMRQNLDWQPFWDAAAPDLPYRERLRATAAVAEQRFDTERFEEFCAQHLAHLDEVAWEFFATDAAREAVRVKVEALFPAHEVAEFTELFWSRIQRWRDEEAAAVTPAAAPVTTSVAAPARLVATASRATRPRGATSAAPLPGVRRSEVPPLALRSPGQECSRPIDVRPPFCCSRRRRRRGRGRRFTCSTPSRRCTPGGV